MSFLASRDSHAPQGIGKSVRRREDARLLTGAGQFADDFNLPSQAYAYVLRSPHPHAKILNIESPSHCLTIWAKLSGTSCGFAGTGLCGIGFKPSATAS
jgi:aerobic carbon-monoxide dehydrogenase large subunit